MDLYIATFVIVVAIIALIIGYAFMVTKISNGGRKRVFQKISEEYGLSFNSQSYPLSTVLIKDKLYGTFSVTGAVRNHSVFIEDTWTVPSSQMSWGTALVVTSMPYGRGAAARASIKNQTRMTVDGAQQFIDNGRSIFPRPASYKEIKMALDNLI